ncbi:MAG: TIGR01777 family protein [Bacteroidales bacterium 45-6]|nr:MAG: TIGR01777 family protein [Bacteroidales bacterium 45-6]
MPQTTILLAGGSGFVGKQLANYFEGKGHTLHILTRAENPSRLNRNNLKFFHWNPQKGTIDKEAFKDVNSIFNLSGANIGEKRWTGIRKQEIIESRLASTRLLFETVRDNKLKIEKIISSSAVGYYGMLTSHETFLESSPPGYDFLAEVCIAWENEALKFEKLGVKVVILRKGIVIGDGGAYKKLTSLAKLGINTCLGNGKQFMPWIDISDLSRIYEFALSHPEMQGIYNAVSDEGITMKKFANDIARSLGKKIITPPAPAFLIRIMLGEMAEMLLTGSRISNGKLKGLGFKFQYPQILESLNHLSNK